MMTEAGPKSRVQDAKATGVVTPHRARWHQQLAAFLVYSLARSVGATIRYRVNDPERVFQRVQKERLIFALWHNRLALSLPIYRRYVAGHSGKIRLAAMVSASRDGGLLARILELFGVQPVRGSSSRRGPQALREMVSWSEQGYDLAITPDGPRGPCYTVQEGVISTAQLTGLPIIPVCYRLDWKIRSKGWDRFQIPLPFSRCEITVARPMRVAREATEADREALRKELEQVLVEITRD